MWHISGPKQSKVFPQNSKFALNAAVDTLPHNVNLHLWKKKENSTCPLCGEQQTLIHVLNCCSVARDMRRYNSRHDGVLQVIFDVVKQSLDPTTNLTVDLNADYSFPTHIAPTDLRPDMVWWDDTRKTMMVTELTIAHPLAMQ